MYYTSSPKSTYNFFRPWIHRPWSCQSPLTRKRGLLLNRLGSWGKLPLSFEFIRGVFV